MNMLLRISSRIKYHRVDSNNPIKLFAYEIQVAMTYRFLKVKHSTLPVTNTFFSHNCCQTFRTYYDAASSLATLRPLGEMSGNSCGCHRKSVVFVITHAT